MSPADDHPGMRLVPPLLLLLCLLLAAPAAAKPRDRDRDGLPDRWERKHDLKVGKRSAKGDPDRDGLRNRAEFKAGTDPRDRDSDDDGVRDGEEIIGVVKSVAGDTIVIRLARGGLLRGSVEAGAVDCGFEEDEEDFDGDEDREESADSEDGDDGYELESGDGELTGEQLAPEDELGSDLADEFGDELGEDSEDDEDEDCGAADLSEGDRVSGADFEDGVFYEIELED